MTQNRDQSDWIMLARMTRQVQQDPVQEYIDTYRGHHKHGPDHRDDGVSVDEFFESH